MLRVGLTGGIGAGKSTAAQYLAQRGAVVIDADQLAREVVAPGSAGFADVIVAFGPDLLVDGELDRSALAERVFADSEARRRLEGIIHPRVRARTEQLMVSAQDSIVVNDVPLLVETGLSAQYHLVVVVEADHNVRLERLVQRGLLPAEAESRMAAQASDAARRVAADVVVENSQDILQLRDRMDSLWERLVLFEENLILRRPTEVSETLSIVPADSSWPEQYHRLAMRIRRAVGDFPTTLDHIGSTAVPGLPAKNVIDIQLGVENLHTADKLTNYLAIAGFPAREGVWGDRPKPSASDPWPKRLHGAADPGRLVNLHIRGIGSPGWRWALLFRDWLRAQPAEVAAYGAEKARLAKLGLTAFEYAEAKEPWFDSVDYKIEEWAAATGWQPVLEFTD